MASEQSSGMFSMVRRRWQLYKIHRSRRRASVSGELARRHREQTRRLLEMQPEPEPMPMSEWLPEFIKDISISARGRIRYRIADLKAVRDCV